MNDEQEKSINGDVDSPKIESKRNLKSCFLNSFFIVGMFALGMWGASLGNAFLTIFPT